MCSFQLHSVFSLTFSCFNFGWSVYRVQLHRAYSCQLRIVFRLSFFRFNFCWSVCSFQVHSVYTFQLHHVCSLTFYWFNYCCCVSTVHLATVISPYNLVNYILSLADSHTLLPTSTRFQLCVVDLCQQWSFQLVFLGNLPQNGISRTLVLIQYLSSGNII